ncbi:hypothetical protein EHO59_00610 [Leptospira semungkisensis]|uniref:Uncharacterized protein n=1 Tax=Leptospira semungkisensis TaxID=2484985 RepID=A0A4R9G7B1_9LEPT|nr:hypothetical protein [Leptospira semungkisensis]TGK06677.1 hypothetical protein EHO59_00610 [Leptospira semungkisensis]
MKSASELVVIQLDNDAERKKNQTSDLEILQDVSPIYGDLTFLVVFAFDALSSDPALNWNLSD